MTGLYCCGGEEESCCLQWSLTWGATTVKHLHPCCARTSTALLKCSSKTAGEDRRRQSCFILFLIKLKINTSLEHLINSNQTNNFFAFSFSKTLPRFPGNTTQLVLRDAGKSSSQPRYTFFPSEEYLNKYITNFISISKDRKYFMFQTKN